MCVKALGAFVVLMAAVGSAHAAEAPASPEKTLDFTVRPSASYEPLSDAGRVADPFRPEVWRSGELSLSPPDSVSDQRLQLSMGERYISPTGLPLTRPEQGLAGSGRSFAIDYSVGVPGALSFSTPGHDWSLTPHAGIGVSDAGGKASAGAELSFKERAEGLLEDLGVRDGTDMRARGRYYLFAAASGRAVGFNLLRDSSSGDIRRAGWTIDPASNLVGEAQLGVGWRRGPLQTSFGYIHRDYDAPLGTRGGMDGKDADMVAFSFSVRPH